MIHYVSTVRGQVRPGKGTKMPDQDNLKAIETIYSGYRFRSRLEARWAVFFDTAGIRYEYEPEGFDLDGTWYLPDFWLPEQECWLEIKPTASTPEPVHERFDKVLRAQRLAEEDNPYHNFYLVSGHPFYDGYDWSYRMWKQRYSRWEDDDRFLQCPLCQRLIIERPYIATAGWGNDQINGIYCEWCNIKDRRTEQTELAYFSKGFVYELLAGSTTLSSVLQRAYAAARAARFEHGEQGRAR